MFVNRYLPYSPESWNGGMVEGGMVEWSNGRMVKWWNDGMAEWQNGGIYPQILKHGMAEYP